MFSTDLKIIRYTPDGDGKGGTKTGLSRFTSAPINDTVSTDNAFVWLNSWKKESDVSSLLPSSICLLAADSPVPFVYVLSLHSFAKYSLSDALAPPTVEIISSVGSAATLQPITFDYNIWNFSTEPTPGTHIVRSSGSNAQAARFLTINNRCLIADGATEAQWYTGSDIRSVIDAFPDTNAGTFHPVVVMVTGTGFVTGQSVTISGAAGCTEANGTWLVDVRDVSSNATKLSLRGTDYQHALTGYGYCYSPNIYPLGAGQPLTAPVITRSIGATGEYYAGKDSSFVAHPDPESLLRKIIIGDTLRLFIPLAAPDDTVQVAATGSAITGTTRSAMPTAYTTGAFPMGNPMGAEGAIHCSSVVVWAEDGKSEVMVYGHVGTAPGTSYELVGAKFYFHMLGGGGFELFGETTISGTILRAVEGTFVGRDSATYDQTTFTVDKPNKGSHYSAIYPGSALACPAWPMTYSDISTPAMVVQDTLAIPYQFELSGVRVPVDSTPFASIDDPPLPRQWPQKFQVSAGGLAFTGAPLYAYAWYDPRTGHMSNISPVAPLSTISPTNVAIDVSQYALHYPQGTDAARFTCIVFFRSLLSSGSSLFVVGGLDPSDKATWKGISSNYIDNLTWANVLSTAASSGSPYTQASIVVVKTDRAHGLTTGNLVAMWDVDGSNASAFPGTFIVEVGDSTHFAIYWVTPETLAGDFTVVGQGLGFLGAATAGIVQSGYWHDSNPDSALLVNGVFRAPNYTNTKPRTISNGITTVLSPKEIAYWDGRVWLVGTQQPSALHYSCDTVQCPLGRPEESFPDMNVIHIPADDGRICGLRLFGESLLITTERWAYTIVGNNETNYRLMRVSTRLSGVGTYQMAEIASEVEGSGSCMVYLGQDHRIYAMTMGNEPTWISREVQDQIDSKFDYYSVHDPSNARNSYIYSRVHVFNISGRRGLVFTTPGPGHFPDGSLMPSIEIYDFDSKVWTTRSFSAQGPLGFSTPLAFASVYGQNPSPIEVVGFQGWDGSARIGTARTWLDPFLGASSSLPSTIKLYPSGFDGQKIRKQIQFVRIYVDTAVAFGTSWTCSVKVDYGTTYTATFIANPDTTFPWVKGTADALYELIVPAAAFNASTNGAPLIGYVFEIGVNFPLDTVRQRLYAIDVGYQPVAGQIDP